MRVVPPQPGVMALSTSGMPQRQLSAIMARSQAMVISSPPPSTKPSATATVILSRSSIVFAKRW